MYIIACYSRYNFMVFSYDFWLNFFQKIMNRILAGKVLIHNGIYFLIDNCKTYLNNKF